MNTKRLLLAVFTAAAFATIYLPTEQVSAQLWEEHGDDELQVVLNYGEGSNEVHLATHRGVAEPVSLGPGQWFPFTLQFPVGKAGSTVKLGCLDGGQITATTSQGQVVLSADGTNPLSVSVNGTMPLSFQAGQTLGLYRVVVQLPDKRYYLHFYLVDSNRPRVGIGGAIHP